MAREFVEYYYERTQKFMQLQAEGLVSNFSLSEPRDVPTYMWGFFALFPRLPLETRPAYLSFSVDPNKDLVPFRSEVLSLRLPDRIRETKLRQDREISTAAEAVMAAQDLPSIVLAVGERYNPTEDVMLLFCVVGMSPEEALKQIQRRTREAIAKNN